MPGIVFAVSFASFIAAHFAAEIGLFFNGKENSIVMLYIGLFFISHFIFFVPVASAKEPYRMLSYVAVMMFAVYNTIGRYEDTLSSPHRFIKHDIFIQPFIMKYFI